MTDLSRDAIRTFDSIVKSSTELDQSLLLRFRPTVVDMFSDVSSEAVFAERLRESGMTIEAWVYTFLVNSAADELESGRRHVYQGGLGLLGNEFYKIFEYFIRKNVAIQTYTAEYAKEKIINLVDRNIKKVG